MHRRRNIALLASLVTLGMAGYLVIGNVFAATRDSGTALLDADFANAASLNAFTRVCGGAWVSGHYVLALPDPATRSSCAGNANVLVGDAAMPADWTLTVRLAALGGSAGHSGFSVVFGYRSPSHYDYANVGQPGAPDGDGVYAVVDGQVLQLAPLAPGAPRFVLRRNYNIALTLVAGRVTLRDDAAVLATAAVPGLGAGTRVGLGSQGSRITARRLDVVAAPADPPGAGASGTATPGRTPAGTVRPTSTPTDPSTPTPAGTPGATPRGTPNPTPRSTPSPTPRPPAPASATPSPSPSAATAASCSPGTFPTAYFAPGFVGPISRTFHEQFITDEGSYLRVCYPAGSTSPSSGHPGGAQAKLSIAAGPRLSYTLTYQIRFPVGFQWVKGGKLPGLCGGQCWTGSNNGPGGWSTRFMWRANGVAEVLLSDATTTGYGTDLFRYSGNWNWQADGQWHTISQTVTMNTPGVANGTIAVSYDGRQVAQATGITFRAAGDTDEIDSLMFTTFFGGHDSSWAPTTTQEIDFANFRVS